MVPIELKNTPLFNDPALVAYWRFEGNSNDSKGSNNGIDTSVTYSSTGGKFGEYASAAGLLTNIQVADATNLRVHQDCSWSLWFMDTLGTYSIYHTLLAKRTTSADSYQIDLEQTNGKILFFNGVTVYDGGASGVTPTVNTWYHLVFTLTGTTSLICYLNGAQIWTATIGTLPSASTSPLGFFQDGSYDSEHFQGRLDDVAIFNRVLTATEVSNLYNGTWGLNPVININQAVNRASRW